MVEVSFDTRGATRHARIVECVGVERERETRVRVTANGMRWRKQDMLVDDAGLLKATDFVFGLGMRTDVAVRLEKC